MYNTIWLVNSTLYFYLISLQRNFCNHKKQWCQGRTHLSSVSSSDTRAINNFGRTSLWWFCTRSSHLRLGHLPNWQFPFHLLPARYTISNAWYLEIFSDRTSSQESLKHKSTFTFILWTIYLSPRSMAQPDISPDSKNTHIRASINEGFWTANNNDAILATLLQHKEDTFSKLTIKNKSQQIRSEQMVYQLSQRCSARLGAAATWRIWGA